MATYYRWRKSTVKYEPYVAGTTDKFVNTKSFVYYPSYSFDPTTGLFSGAGNMEYVEFKNIGDSEIIPFPAAVFSNEGSSNSCRLLKDETTVTYVNDLPANYLLFDPSMDHYRPQKAPDDFIGYVYSANSTSYPYDGVLEDYYYDQRTTITSPTAPTNIRYPNPITTPTVTVSWGAATSSVPSYSVSKYELSYALNGGNTWKSAGSTSKTKLEFEIPLGATSIKFRVRAQDSNGQWSSYTTGTVSNVLQAPTITAPSIAMQNQPITINWTEVDTATSYILQRKADTDDDWVEVYRGHVLTFMETVGTWTTVQYQVQAVFSVGPGGWGTSKVIPVVSASALVISGQDGYLGTLTADVPYTVSTDTGKPITVERKVNGQVVASIEASSNFVYDIPIYDLPTGAGTITLTCSVTPEGQAPVQAERKWTYYKAPVLFPQTGSTAQITKEGENIYPLTIAEAVKVPTNWGGSLDKALEMLLPVVSAAVISVGTYEGTGTFGVDNPNTLTLDDEPLVVTVYGDGRTLVISSTEASAPAHISGCQAKWYSTESAADQMNSDGVTYSFVAVAKGVQA